MSSIYSQDDYASAAIAHLPRGLVWPRDSGTDLHTFWLALAGTWQRLDARAVQLRIDTFPRSTVDLLPEWEASVGLPDPCAGPNPTFEQRRNQVVARIVGKGGQSRAFFTQFAAELGIEIEIRTFAPFRAGRSAAGDPCAGQEWVFNWEVHILSVAGSDPAAAFRAGFGHAGDPLTTRAVALSVLQCELQRLKAAETILNIIS
ncbi:MAG TPA: putative phage tail protein [Sphingobium sp.]|uniref:YmfQ family protein n=1 Tax=Sphingobium sp. TaxID=1912891 RepID=UPI002ED2162C